jgi:hypothetical protein
MDRKGEGAVSSLSSGVREFPQALKISRRIFNQNGSAMVE